MLIAMYYVYVLLSETLKEHYVGYSTDLRSRVATHNKGGVVATKNGRPWKPVYYEAYLTEALARKRGLSLKRNRGRSLQLLYKRIMES